MTEDGLITWLRTLPGTDLIGDDTAFLPSSERWVVTVDQQIEGVHVPAWLAPEDRAARLVAVNLSDLAAASALPVWGFLALASPVDWDHRPFLRGVAEALARHGARLAGGDLARHDVPVASLTLLGAPPRGAAPPGRSGARPGHALWVGGTLGMAALGLRAIERGIRIDRPETVPASLAAWGPLLLEAVRRQLRPTAQLDLGTWLAGRATAALDVSDGLALDLHRLCRESDVGCRIEEDRIPLALDFDGSCRALDLRAEDLWLAGGEDYVLLFTLPEGTSPPSGHGARRIGVMTESPTVELRTTAGETRTISPRGWDHLSDV